MSHANDMYQFMDERCLSVDFLFRIPQSTQSHKIVENKASPNKLPKFKLFIVLLRIHDGYTVSSVNNMQEIT